MPTRTGPWRLFRAGLETKRFAARQDAIDWYERYRRPNGAAQPVIEHETTGEKWRRTPWGAWEIIAPGRPGHIAAAEAEGAP